jgi:hypothetical protein
MLMHILLSGILPVTIMACIPIIASLGASFIDPTQIITLGVFEFGQVLLVLIIVGTFVILKEKKMQSQINFNAGLDKLS